jgi:hypothetical protein
MPTAGRNEPCPCGSGRKFKHCCGATTPAPSITKDDRNAAMHALLRFSRRPEFDEVRAATPLAWAVDDFGDDVRAALQSFLEFETATVAYFDWLFFDNPLADGRSIAQRFLAGPPRGVSPRAVDYIRLMSDTHLRPYQIRQILPDRGLQVRDLWTGDDLFITERAATTQVKRWQLLIARLVTHTDGSVQMESTPLVLPAAARRDLIGDLKRAYRAYSQEPGATVPRFFRTHAPLFHDYWIEWVAADEEVELFTTEGDPVTASLMEFDVPNTGEALVSLLLQPDFTPGAFGTANWMDRSGGGGVHLATIDVSRGRLTLRAFSQARTNRARRRLEEVLGPLSLIREEH